MGRTIRIFDTTLRDGEQSPGCSMNLTEKIEMARQLEKLGVDVIEAGFAIASPMDHKSVQAIAAAVTNCTVASLARCAKGDALHGTPGRRPTPPASMSSSRRATSTWSTSSR